VAVHSPPDRAGVVAPVGPIGWRRGPAASVGGSARLGTTSPKGAVRCARSTGTATGSSARRARPRPCGPVVSVSVASRPSMPSLRDAAGCARCTGAGMASNGHPVHLRAPRPCGRASSVGSRPRGPNVAGAMPATTTGTGPAASAPRSGGSAGRAWRMATRTCRICGDGCPPRQRLRAGRCPRCAQYWRRHGVERPLQFPPRPVLPPRPCQTCGQFAQRLRRGRCIACYDYWHRTGRERPPERWGR
jgi:hypothetical protein